ncbi:MCE family protein [Nocardia uniformis]|uniref:MCE family protein n=1 Tax=Nocardia uniformis TaxID=53432 RepID=A0A849CGU3_9NOCA|nr:MlaD family protein [Nocardia uniformis]NNH72741.1 MCE family protein [Nocardia uniformis]
MKPSSIVSLASIVAILIAGTSYLAFGVVRVHPFRDTITATLTVPDSGGLIPRSKVLLTGVEVGEVTEVNRTVAGIKVVFRADAEYPIPTSSSVRIRGLSGLGEPYLEFRPSKGGDGPYLQDGQTVQTGTITRPMSIPDVARNATQLLEQLEPEVLTDIVDTFSTALSGTETVIPQLSHSTELLAATLLSRTDVIRQLLIAMQANAGDMAWSGPALTDAAGPWADFGPRIADVAAAIARVIRSGDVPAEYLTDTPDTVGLLPFLHELTTKIGTIGPELAPLIPVLQPVVASATGTLHNVDISSLISQALATTSADGTLQLQLTVK